MTTPDDLVAEHGETVQLTRVTDYDLDDNGQVIESSLVTETVTIKAIVSKPSEKDERRLEGRLSTGSLKLTVDSGTDIEVKRGGQPDQITRNGTLYQVVDVQDDTNPLTGTQKLSVFVDLYSGRSTDTTPSNLLIVPDGQTHTVAAGTGESYVGADIDGTLTVADGATLTINNT